MALPTPITPARAESALDVVVATAFQPVVDLQSGRAVAAEALLRGTLAGVPVPPSELLERARAVGMLAELDLASARSAVRGASAGGHGALFLNIEPSTLIRHVGRVLEAIDERRPDLEVVVEVTERLLAEDPAGLLAAVERLHAHGTAIALDDVGAHPQSLALLDLVQPAVVKLDMSLLRSARDTDALHVAGAVAGYAEARGARVVAEGIETADDLRRAQVLGADLGQGWWWGRPAPAWPEQDAARFATTARLPHQRGPATPFQLIGTRRPVRTATKDLLVPLSFAVEAAAASAHLPSVLLATFQHARNVPTSTLTRYRTFAGRLPVVGMLGEAVAGLDVPGAHLADVEHDDDLAREWCVVALSADGAVAFAARETPAAVSRDGDRVFQFATTRNRDLVARCAAALIRRLGPTEPASR